MDAPLCGTRVTGQLIQNILLKSTDIDIGDNRVSAVEAEVLGDQGYTSIVLRVKLIWSSTKTGHHLPESVIVKAIGSNALEDFFDKATTKDLNEILLLFSHNVECAIYTLEELQKMVPMPRCYGYIENEHETPSILALEDLRDRGVLLPKTEIWSNGLNPTQLENLLESLSTLHAWSLNTRVDWQSKILTIASNLAIATFAESSRSSVPKAKKEFPALFDGLDEEKLNQYLTKDNFVEIFGSDPRKKYNLPLVLVHGDVQPLNMLFEKNENGKAGDQIAALLDWQVAHRGCGVEDVIRVTGMCVSTEVRRELAYKILERYVELFNQKVNNKENRINFANAKNAYNEMFAFNGIMFGCNIAAMGNVAERMTGLTDEERKNAKQSLVEKMAENYKDAIKILGW